MLTGPIPGRFCDGFSRRNFLRVGALGVGALGLGDLLRLRAEGSAAAAPRSVIMIYLEGGPSHIDMYDLKPDAPAEIRGEFKPIQTKVPGFDLCELMPRQAQIADKLAVVRNWVGGGGHNPDYIDSGGDMKRPAFGPVVSKLRGGLSNVVPPYVAIAGGGGGSPVFLGDSHQPFQPYGPVMQNMTLKIPAARLADRRELLRSFDTLQREASDRLASSNAITARALDTITSNKVRDALDLSREPDRSRNSYGRLTSFLQARRLVEAGVSFVSMKGPGGWDTHAGADQKSETNFATLRRQLPELDDGVATLVSDIAARGLDQEVCVIVWGEFGRTPRVNKHGGRDHWETGFVLFAGGGLKMGQAIGATDARAERAIGVPYTSQNVLATLYRALGIDLETTLTDHLGRPHYLLDDRRPIKELV